MLEELEPDNLLQNEKVAHVFETVREAVGELTNRRAKVEVLLDHLKEQSEDIIEDVFRGFRESSVIHMCFFMNTKEFKDAGKLFLFISF